jgi:hypothetical protein
MHPYIAYLLLTEPATHHTQPNALGPNLQQALRALGRHWRWGGGRRR